MQLLSFMVYQAELRFWKALFYLPKVFFFALADNVEPDLEKFWNIMAHPFIEWIVLNSELKWWYRKYLRVKFWLILLHVMPKLFQLYNQWRIRSQNKLFCSLLLLSFFKKSDWNLVKNFIKNWPKNSSLYATFWIATNWIFTWKRVWFFYSFYVG